jgi:hypothetical protein
MGNKNIEALVDRFLSWPLPKTVCSDLCVTDSAYPHSRVGTNLLTADEARQMIEYLSQEIKAPWYPKLGMKDEPIGLTEIECKRIREIKRGCTYRRLAEVWYPDPAEDLHGNQLAGEDLCREACAVLGIDWMHPPEFPSTPEFDQVNKSYHGDFYWWD